MPIKPPAVVRVANAILALQKFDECGSRGKRAVLRPIVKSPDERLGDPLPLEGVGFRVADCNAAGGHERDRMINSIKIAITTAKATIIAISLRSIFTLSWKHYLTRRIDSI